METSENTLREFPLVIATVAKVSHKHGLWLVVRVNHRKCECMSHLYELHPHFFLKQFVIPLPHFYHNLTGKSHCHKMEFWYNSTCKV